MADEAVIVAAAAGLWYLLRGKKRTAREEAPLPVVVGPQPKAIPAIPARPVVMQAATFQAQAIVPLPVQPKPLPPIIEAALRPEPPPVKAFQTVPPPPPVPVAVRAPEQRFTKPRFRTAHGRLMPMAHPDHTYPPIFPNFMK